MKVNIITPFRLGGPYFFGKNLTEILKKKGIAAIWTHELPKLLLTPLWQKTDVVHSAGIPITYRLWKKPFVLTIHGEYPIEKTIWQPLYPLAIRKADIVTTASHFLRERLNLQDALVIPNAIYPEKFNVVEHTEKDVLNLVTVSSFFFEDKARGILDILKILGDLPKEARKKIQYSIVGGGSYLKTLMSEVKKHEVNVQFTGMLQNPKEVLEKSDIFLYYSYHDNFPNVILEAIACGLPIITNTVGAVSEIIEHGTNGFISTNQDTYYDYLLKLISSFHLRVKLGEKARKAIESKFSWENIIGQYTDIYRKLV